MAASVSAEQLTFGTIDPETGKLHLDWDDALGISYELGQRIIKHCAETGEAFDKILAVPRGSYYPTNIIARLVGAKGTDILQASLGSYDDGEEVRNDDFEYGQMPTEADISGNNILVIEEVCDTANTLTELDRQLREMGMVLGRYATLHFKPAKNETGFLPDLWVDTTDRWIVYPWEPLEEEGNEQKVQVMRKKLLVPNQAVHIEQAHAA
jgi:hypoxanthine phosphoribosyltransferase